MPRLSHGHNLLPRSTLAVCRSYKSITSPRVEFKQLKINIILCLLLAEIQWNKVHSQVHITKLHAGLA